MDAMTIKKRPKVIIKHTYISIFRNVNQLIIGTVDMRNLQNQVQQNKIQKQKKSIWGFLKTNSENPKDTYITIVGRRNNIFKLLAGENVNSNKVTFCMSMLASL